VPLVFGIVGSSHPSAADDAALRAALQEIFDGCRDAYPNTPLRLLSALAPGTDQIAAEVALGCGVTVCAPLPFPAEEYAGTLAFSASSAGVAAEKMLGWVRDKAVESFLVPLPGQDGQPAPVDWSTMVQSATRQQTCCANAAGYIVRQCHVLIALWDGNTERSGAGHDADFSPTEGSVAMKLYGTAPAFYPWIEPLGLRSDRGPVCVVCPPGGAGSPPTAQCRFTVLFPGESQPQPGDVLWARSSPGQRFLARIQASLGLAKQHSPHTHHEEVPPSGLGTLLALDERSRHLPSTAELRQFQETCAAIDRFNADVAGQSAAMASAPSSQAYQDWDKTWVTMGLPPEESPDGQIPPLRRAARLRDLAGAAAGQFDKQMKIRQRLLFAFICTAAVSFHTYIECTAGPERHRPLLLYSFLFTVLLSLVVVIEVWWQRLDQRRLDYRALAEALRVFCFWALAGLEDSVPDSYLGQLRSEMAWTHRAIRTVSPPPQMWREEFGRLSREQQAKRIEIVRERWAAAQQEKFYAPKSHQNHLKARRCRIVGFTLALCGWLTALTLLPNVKPNEAPELSIAAPPQGATQPEKIIRPLEADPPPEIAQSPGAGTKPMASESSSPPSHEPAAPSGTFPNEARLFLSGFFILLGGFVLVICEKCFYEELAKQYERLDVVFADGARELLLARAAGDIARAQDTIRALGCEAITEHAQWLILRRARPFELHIA
jgi:hypothetical protein